jgi:hypothetical protein
MKKLNLNKNEIQKLAVSVIGFVILLYVYFGFFLGPLRRSQASMVASIKDLQDKVGSSGQTLANATNLEKQASAATTRYAVLTNSNPEGAPIAWFPPRIKVFFANQQIEKATARLEGNLPYKEADLTGWTRYNWTIDLPQTDFSILGYAVAELENTEPLLSINHINIHALGDDPQFQQVSLSVATAILKR